MRTNDQTSTLFSDFDLAPWLADRLRAFDAEIERFEPERVLHSALDVLTGYLVERYRVEPLVAELDAWSADAEEDYPDLEADEDGHLAHRLSVRVAYSGDETLFGAAVGSTPFAQAAVRIESRFLVLGFRIKQGQEQHARALVEQALRALGRSLDEIGRQVTAYNDGLVERAAARVGARQQALQAHRALLTALGVSMSPREPSDEPDHERVRAELPPLSRETPASDAALPLSVDARKRIVEMLRSASAGLCHSPDMFAVMTEPSLRDYHVLRLNACLQAPGTGDAFVARGSQDFSLQIEGHASLWGRCVFWRGDPFFQDELNALLSAEPGAASERLMLVFAPYRRRAATLTAISASLSASASFSGDVDDALGGDLCVRLKQGGNEVGLTLLVVETPAGSGAKAIRQPRRAATTGRDQMGFGF
ncbi:hypothetical protein [Pseudomonas matsuisoli]|uniref:Uncharacterized protein n=1 Tax=Pseudomonas matsuisoli TaxID=1515666 RepID=A0A917PYE3_9PSED|nr:hypothetical protein [Pseudomonas matsuisoli]GGK00940.1 hypothetical protein GCM10009304_28460 [Pseudomonas matsuisoli]